MHPSFLLLLSPLASLPCALAGAARAQEPSDDDALRLLAQAPPCDTPCFVAAMANSTCALSDFACICHDEALIESAGACILESCTIPQALAIKNSTQTACGVPVRDRSGQYRAMAIALGALSVFFVLIRIVFKLFFFPRSRSSNSSSHHSRLSADDQIILATLALRISCTVFSVRGLAANGLGRNVWALAPARLAAFLMWLYVMEILYLAELSLLKLGLAAFYLCIFPGPAVRRLLLGTCVLHLLGGVAFVTAAIFQCRPVRYWWTRFTDNDDEDGLSRRHLYHHHDDGQCINVNALGWSHAIFSVLMDLLMIAIPLSQVPKLHLHWRKKLGVIVMFLTGTFVTVVSILRLGSLVSFANSNNPTWDQWETIYWSTTEVNVGMICTCLPCLRLLLVRLFPQVLGSSCDNDKTNNSATVSSHDRSRGGQKKNALNSRVSHGTFDNDNELANMDRAEGTSEWRRNDAAWSAKELLDTESQRSRKSCSSPGR